MDAGNVLQLLDAVGDGTVATDELARVLEHLAPGEWTSDKFKQLVSSLGERNGRVNIGKLFEPDALPKSGGMLKAAIFSAASYVQDFMQPFVDAFPSSFFVEADLSAATAHRCQGANAVCVFVNDTVDAEVLQILKAHGVRLLLLRCAGFDRVDLEAAEAAGIKVARVPAYSPYAVAEHAVSLVVTLNRRLHLAAHRIRSGNYEVSGLVGMDLHGKTVGIFGTGKIGQIAAKVFKGFGMRVICYDIFQNDAIKELGGEYMEQDQIYKLADVISLHVPLLPSTKRMINRDTIAKMKPGVILVNVSRGGLVDTTAIIEGLACGTIRALGLDVYDKEADIFFKDFSSLDDREHMKHWDKSFALLRSFPNVLITPHSAFLTSDALHSIVTTTIQNAQEFLGGQELTNIVKAGPEKAYPPLTPAGRLASQAPGALARRRLSSDVIIPEEFKDMTPNPDVKVAVFSTTQYVRTELRLLVSLFPKTFFVEASSSPCTAYLCDGAQAVCLFNSDNASREVLKTFKDQGVKLILLRCYRSDNVDLKAAEELGIKVTHVPMYSPHAVAEHAVSLCMCLNRHLHRCYTRVQEGIFILGGLVGMDLNGKVCGIMGTGKIGQIAARIFKGLGMQVICYDVSRNDVITKELGLQYVEKDEIYTRSDVITLHVPLTPATKYMINDEAIEKMKPGTILINVCRGALVNTNALVQGLASGKLGAAGLDVCEQQEGLFFHNFSEMDDNDRLDGVNYEFQHLRSFPNVLITPHTAFLTHEALQEICVTTVTNLQEFVDGRVLSNSVKATH